MNQPISLREATRNYLEYLKEWGKSPRTIYTYGKDLEQIQAFFGDERDLASILNVHIGKFIKSDVLLRLPNGNQRAEATVKKTLRVLRQFFQWAYQEKMITTLPLPKEFQKTG